MYGRRNTVSMYRVCLLPYTVPMKNTLYTYIIAHTLKDYLLPRKRNRTYIQVILLILLPLSRVAMGFLLYGFWKRVLIN